LEDEKVYCKKPDIFEDIKRPKNEKTLPKKVMEAKLRNKMKAFRKLESLKKKASILENSDKLEDVEKFRTILANFYKKQVRGRRKKLVVAKGKLKGCSGRPKGVKGRYKMLDNRMKKDKRNSDKK
jgi:AdoMet-dependent rRNA methyltransferase SPB1